MTRRKRGRPGFWKGKAGLKLVDCLHQIMAERQRGLADAAQIARKRHSWLRDYPSTETRYYELRKLHRQQVLAVLGQSVIVFDQQGMIVFDQKPFTWWFGRYDGIPPLF
jgi:hypothetical protein